MALRKTQQKTEVAVLQTSPALRSGYPQPHRWLAWWGSRRPLLRREDGGTLIEFALVFTTMMSFVLVVMELCLAFYSYGMICETARATTRWAAMRGTTCVTFAGASCTTTKAAVSSHAMTLGFPNIGGGTMSVDTTNMFPDLVPVTSAVNCEVPGVCRVKVVIAYTVPITLPLVPKNAISLSTSSEMYFVQ